MELKINRKEARKLAVREEGISQEDEDTVVVSRLVFMVPGRKERIYCQQWNCMVLSSQLPLKDVRANCFCASLLRTQIHMPRHATSCIERAR